MKEKNTFVTWNTHKFEKHLQALKLLYITLYPKRQNKNINEKNV